MSTLNRSPASLPDTKNLFAKLGNALVTALSNAIFSITRARLLMTACWKLERESRTVHRKFVTQYGKCEMTLKLELVIDPAIAGPSSTESATHTDSTPMSSSCMTYPMCLTYSAHINLTPIETFIQAQERRSGNTAWSGSSPSIQLKAPLPTSVSTPASRAQAASALTLRRRTYARSGRGSTRPSRHNKASEMSNTTTQAKMQGR